MVNRIFPPKDQADHARFRSEKDDWLLKATSPEAPKYVLRVAPFIYVHLNSTRADFFWGVKAIANHRKMSVPMVERALKWLRDNRFLTKLKRLGQHGTSRYALVIPDVDPSPNDGLTDNVDPSFLEGPTNTLASSTHHFSHVEPSFSTSRPITECRTNPSLTPEETDGCADKAQQPSVSLNTGKSDGIGENTIPKVFAVCGPLTSIDQQQIDHLERTSAEVSGDDGTLTHSWEDQRETLKFETASKILEEAGYTKERLKRNAEETRRRREIRSLRL